MKKDRQFTLLNKPLEEEWKLQWREMPEYIQEEDKSYAKIIFRFLNEKDLQDFCKLIGQKFNQKTKSAWHPKRNQGLSKYRYIDEEDES